LVVDFFGGVFVFRDEVVGEGGAGSASLEVSEDGDGFSAVGGERHEG